MRGLRTWLDHKELQTAGFKVAGHGKIGFEITFFTEQDALTFGSFEWIAARVSNRFPIAASQSVVR